MTRFRVRENGTVKKRRDSRTSKDVLDEAQAHHQLKILAMMALFAQQQDIDPMPYMVCALINGLIIEDIQRDRNSLTAPIERKCLKMPIRTLSERFTGSIKTKCPDYFVAWLSRQNSDSIMAAGSMAKKR